jgi:hypothetical protein
MEEEAFLVVRSSWNHGEVSPMNSGRSIVGATSGLVLAAILIAGVSLAGGGSLHLDLVKANGPGAGSSGLSTSSGQVGGTTVAPQTGEQTTQAASASSESTPISSLDSLTSQGGGTIGLLLLPILLGAVLGALFYGTYARRIDAD